MNVERILILLLILIIFTPAVHAKDDSDILLQDYDINFERFENCTKISQEPIGPGSVTTIHNITMHWQNGLKITYKNNEGKQDYFIVWKCNISDEYYFLFNLHELSYHYSDYAKDNKSVVYVNLGTHERVYGILVDTQNITYSEEELVHGILGHYNYELTNSGFHYNPPIDVHDASHHHTSYKSLRGDQWDMAINDPDWYYDHYDYGDNGDVDEYLYEYYYW